MKQLTILELANKLDVTIPDFINDYSNKFELIDTDSIEDIESIIEYSYYQDDIAEYADSLVPVYYGQIEKEYEESSFTIDDIIYEGLMESMGSEEDINKAKQCALFMHYEAIAYDELEEFKREIKNALGKVDIQELFA